MDEIVINSRDTKNLQANGPSLNPITDLKTEYTEKPSRSVLVNSNPENKNLISKWDFGNKNRILYCVNSNITGDKNINSELLSNSGKRF